MKIKRQEGQPTFAKVSKNSILQGAFGKSFPIVCAVLVAGLRGEGHLVLSVLILAYQGSSITDPVLVR